jgi:hypothetical protein
MSDYYRFVMYEKRVLISKKTYIQGVLFTTMAGDRAGCVLAQRALCFLVSAYNSTNIATSGDPPETG